MKESQLAAANWSKQADIKGGLWHECGQSMKKKVFKYVFVLMRILLNWQS